MTPDREETGPIAPPPGPRPWHRRARTILGLWGIFIGIIGFLMIRADRQSRDKLQRTLSEQADRFRAAEQARPATTATSPSDIAVVMWEGRTVSTGNRVRIAKWAGTFKPEDTGATVEVVADRGHTGTVIRGERRQSEPYMRIDPNEAIQIVRIRWAPQKWKVAGRDQWIDLPEFEATIHVSYLEVVR